MLDSCQSERQFLSSNAQDFIEDSSSHAIT